MLIDFFIAPAKESVPRQNDAAVLMAESRMPWSLACMQHTTISSEKRNCLLLGMVVPEASPVRADFTGFFLTHAKIGGCHGKAQDAL